jgi:hypothetical protein
MIGRSKILRLTIVLILVMALLFFLRGGQLNLSEFTNFMDESNMRIIMLGLMGIVTLEAVGLYVLARRTPEMLTGYTEPQKVFASEQRGRGRPRKPCGLALTGVLSCPLEPDLEMDPAFISKLSAAVADFQHSKLGTQSTSLTDLEAESPAKTEKKTGEQPKEKEKLPGQKDADETDGSKEKEGIGGLVVEMTEVLSRKQEGKKDDKKEKRTP